MELHTDACSLGIAAILMQDDQPVEYICRMLNPAESQYITVELELLGVVNALWFFCVYLLDRQFCLAMDHIASKWLHKFQESKSRLFRWSHDFSQYDFVVHKPGTKIRHVEDLSRVNCGIVW